MNKKIITIIITILFLTGCQLKLNPEDNKNYNATTPNSSTTQNNLPTAPAKQTTTETLRQLFAKKYPKYSKTITVKIGKETENFIRGTIQMQSNAPGGIFLATKEGYWPVKNEGEWKIIFDGNGIISCDLKDKYGFPQDMVADCAYQGYEPPILPPDQPTSAFKIFFATPNEKGDFDCTTFNHVTRIVPRTTAVAKTALELLFLGPTAEEKARGYHSFWITKELSSNLKRVFIKNNIAYLDWTENTISDIGNASTSCGQSTFFGPINKTLTQFPEIKYVVHAINSQPEKFYDWMQMGCGYTKDYGFDYCDATPYK